MLGRSSLRYLFRHPWLTLLSLLGIAVGVAVGVAVDLANTSALRAFTLSGEAVTGQATHQVVGGPGGVPGALYTRLRVDETVEAAPVVEGYARAETDSARVLQILGVDLFAEAGFRPFIAPEGGGSGVDPALFLTVSGAVVLSSGTAEALGVRVGDGLGLVVDGRPVEGQVVALLDPSDGNSESALENLLVVDVATAQAWLGMEGSSAGALPEERASGNRAEALGQLSRIDLLLPEETAAADVARIEALLPEGLGVQPATTQAATLEKMTAAFRLNLSALSMLALLVGLFLIYNTITFAVVQRRKTLGTYRALGVTRREVFRLVLGEALAVGAVGTALGVALGIVLGAGLVQLVTQTIGDLYFAVRVRELALDPWALGRGVALGLGASILGALRPGWEAASIAPASALRRSTEEDKLARNAGRLALGGLVAAAAGTAVLFVPVDPATGVATAYLGLLLIVIGAALAAPWATRGFAAAVRPIAGKLFGPEGRMAARGIRASLSRTAVAVAALAVAVAATVGVSTMVDSFRTTVQDWLGSVLVADVYISPPSTVFRRGGAVVDDSLAVAFAALPGVTRADPIRVRTLSLEGGDVDLVVANVDPTRAAIYRYKVGDPDAIAASLQGGAVAVSEPFAFRFGVTAGDTLTLPTDRGPRRYPVAGVYFDYGNDLGVILMDVGPFQQAFRDVGITGIALTAAEGVDPEALVARARALTEGRQRLDVRSNRTLRETSIAVFDQTFLVTSVLRLLAVGVAFVGVLSALMALQLERRRELANLRAQGMTPAEVRRMVIVQTGLMGLWAGVLALPLGVAFAAVLVFVVNVRSFGWTLAFSIDPVILGQALALAVGAALLAGLYPAWAMSRADPALALREEGA